MSDAKTNKPPETPGTTGADSAALSRSGWAALIRKAKAAEPPAITSAAPAPEPEAAPVAAATSPAPEPEAAPPSTPLQTGDFDAHFEQPEVPLESAPHAAPSPPAVPSRSSQENPTVSSAVLIDDDAPAPPSPQESSSYSIVGGMEEEVVETISLPVRRPATGGHARPATGAHPRPASDVHTRPATGSAAAPPPPAPAAAGASPRPTTGTGARPASGSHARPTTGAQSAPPSGQALAPGAAPAVAAPTAPLPVVPRPVASADPPSSPKQPLWAGVPPPAQAMELHPGILFRHLEETGIITAADRKELMLKLPLIAAKARANLIIRWQEKIPEIDEYFENPIETVAAFDLPLKDGAGTVDEAYLTKAVAAMAEIPYAELDLAAIRRGMASKTISRAFAVKYVAAPLAMDDKTFTIATADPWNKELYKDLAQITGREIRVLLAPRSRVLETIFHLYDFAKTVAQQHRTQWRDDSRLVRAVMLGLTLAAVLGGLFVLTGGDFRKLARAETYERLVAGLKGAGGKPRDMGTELRGTAAAAEAHRKTIESMAVETGSGDLSAKKAGAVDHPDDAPVPAPQEGTP